MKLASRFYLFLIPVFLLTTGLSSLSAWREYNETINRFVGGFIKVDRDNFRLLAANPLLDYYFMDSVRGYREETNGDVQDIRVLFAEHMEEALKLLRNPHHLALFDREWRLVTELYHQPEGHPADIQGKDEITHFKDRFADPSVVELLLSARVDNHHKMVIRLPGDADGDGIVAPGETLGYLHGENLMPIDRYFHDARAEVLFRLEMALLQIALLVVVLYWVGRSVPRPFERMAAVIGQLPIGDPTFRFEKSGIHELDVLGAALVRMGETIHRHQDALMAAKARVESSERMLRLVLDTIPVRVFWKDPEGRYLGCNREFSHAAGFSEPLSVVGKTDAELCWAEDAGLYREEDRAVFEGRAEVANLERTQRDCQGRTIWIEVSKRPLTDTSDQIVGVLGTSHDITARKRAEEERDRFFEASPDAMCILGMDGCFKRVNPSLVEKIGSGRGELVSASFVDLVHSEDREAACGYLDELIQGEAAVLRADFRFGTFDSKPPVIAWSAVAQAGSIYAVGRDVTEQRRMERQLLLTQASVEQAMDALYWIDAGGHFFFVNEAACRALGQSREALLHLSLSDVDLRC
ncbi:MAG: PAS domain S-box protein, partial [Magnetococcales bacterium]|nr:PAS domain S-box protein [Magnetococcales bacterium]